MMIRSRDNDLLTGDRLVFIGRGVRRIAYKDLKIILL